jgi:FkbM family methyltransferase
MLVGISVQICIVIVLMNHPHTHSIKHIITTTTATTTTRTHVPNVYILIPVRLETVRDQWSFEQFGLPSLANTIEDQYNYTVLIGIDETDRGLGRCQRLKAPQGIHLRIVSRPKMTPFTRAVNILAGQAYSEGATHMMRVNDDTKFVTRGWTTMAIQKLGSMKDIGVVGPTFSEGNTAIMVFDFVTRTHYGIHGFYYPPELSNWWADDWITRVYGKQSIKIKGWRVQHIMKHGMRYKVDEREADSLEQLIRRGRYAINRYTQSPLPLRAIVLTKNRPKSLQRLLKSIGKATSVDIHTDDVNLGLRGAWLSAWMPTSPYERAIILEDDVELSPMWKEWLDHMWTCHYDLEGLAGITLQRQTLVPKKPRRDFTIINNNKPFMYRLVGSIGFSPHPVVWKQFIEWTQTLDLNTFRAEVPGLITSDWYNHLNKRTMWTQLFIRYCHDRDLYTLYITPPDGKTMASHWREPGEHHSGRARQDFPLVARLPEQECQSAVAKYGWDGKEQHSIIRLGTNYGGWVHNPVGMTNNSIVYSVGIGEDASWDMAMNRRYGSDVFAFDPTPRAINYVKQTKGLGNWFKFTHEGLYTREGIETFTMPANPKHVSMRLGALPGKKIKMKVNTLENWMKRNGHTHIDILKIDIEGAEYSVIDDMIQRNWWPMDQLLVEFHPSPKKEKTIKRLEGVFSINHNTPNEYSFQRRGQSMVIMQMINYGFIEITRNWIANINQCCPLIAKQMLYLATDKKVYKALVDIGVNTRYVPYGNDEKMNYGSIQYYRYMQFRTEFILSLLNNNTIVWLVESDAVWFKDPSSEVLNTPGDVVTMSDVPPPRKMLQGGFQLIRPTPRSIQLWTLAKRKHAAILHRLRNKKNVGDGGSEQLVLNALLPTIEGLTVSWLDPTRFVAGHSFGPRKKETVVMLNNWIVGNDAKIRRAKKYGYWFIKDVNGSQSL